MQQSLLRRDCTSISGAGPYHSAPSKQAEGRMCLLAANKIAAARRQGPSRQKRQCEGSSRPPEQERRRKSSHGQTAGMSRFVKNKQQLVSDRHWPEDPPHLVKQSLPSVRKLSLDKQGPKKDQAPRCLRRSLWCTAVSPRHFRNQLQSAHIVAAHFYELQCK